MTDYYLRAIRLLFMAVVVVMGTLPLIVYYYGFFTFEQAVLFGFQLIILGIWGGGRDL